jgi:hypothetical protein
LLHEPGAAAEHTAGSAATPLSPPPHPPHPPRLSVQYYRPAAHAQGRALKPACVCACACTCACVYVYVCECVCVFRMLPLQHRDGSAAPHPTGTELLVHTADAARLRQEVAALEHALGAPARDCLAAGGEPAFSDRGAHFGVCGSTMSLCLLLPRACGPVPPALVKQERSQLAEELKHTKQRLAQQQQRNTELEVPAPPCSPAACASLAADGACLLPTRHCSGRMRCPACGWVRVPWRACVPCRQACRPSGRRSAVRSSSWRTKRPPCARPCRRGPPRYVPGRAGERPAHHVVLPSMARPSVPFALGSFSLWSRAEVSADASSDPVVRTCCSHRLWGLSLFVPRRCTRCGLSYRGTRWTFAPALWSWRTRPGYCPTPRPPPPRLGRTPGHGPALPAPSLTARCSR